MENFIKEKEGKTRELESKLAVSKEVRKIKELQGKAEEIQEQKRLKEAECQALQHELGQAKEFIEVLLRSLAIKSEFL